MFDGRAFELAILLDTGALNANYISKRFVDQYRDLFQSHITINPVDTKLADGKTVLPVSEWLDLTIAIVHKGEPTTAVLSFGVLQSCSQDAIIGLPGIFYHFFDLFITLMHDAKAVLDKLPKLPQKTPCSAADATAQSSSELAAAEINAVATTDLHVPLSNWWLASTVEDTPPRQRPDPEPPPCPPAPPQTFDRSPHFEPPADMTGLRYPWSRPVDEDAPEDNDQSNPLP